MRYSSRATLEAWHEFEDKEIPQGGLWEYRHQFNIADSGFGLSGPRVLNDRAGKIGRTLSAGDFDLGWLFDTRWSPRGSAHAYPAVSFDGDRAALVEDLREALYAAKIISYAQEYTLM